jgi:hypothetical protein
MPKLESLAYLQPFKGRAPLQFEIHRAGEREVLRIFRPFDLRTFIDLQIEMGFPARILNLATEFPGDTSDRFQQPCFPRGVSAHNQVELAEGKLLNLPLFASFVPFLVLEPMQLHPPEDWPEANRVGREFTAPP